MTIPVELQKYDQWVLWRLESRNKSKETKVPYTIRGTYASSTNKSTWSSYQAVCEALKATEGRDSGYSGIGFVLTDEDPFVGVDLDHCIKDGVIEEWAQSIVDKLQSYTEITPSGEGLRIFIRATLPREGRKRGNFEVYESGRYLTITGNHLKGTPRKIHERQSGIETAHVQIFADANFIGVSSPNQPLPITAITLSPKEQKSLNRKIRRLAKQSPLFALTLLRQREDLPDKSQSSYDMALARRMALTGEFTPAEISTVIAMHRAQHEQDTVKAGRLDYLQRTMGLAFQEVMDGD